MGFKEVDCVLPGKKEHGSSFWISEWKALLFSNTIQAHTMHLLPPLPKYVPHKAKANQLEGYN